MLYLFYGTESFLIEKEIEKIVTDSNIELININNYNMEEDSVKDIIEDASTISLFDDKKIVIVNNSYIFTGTTKKNSDDDLSIWLDYINNYNPSTIVIFKIITDKLDSRKKVVTAIKKQGTVKEFYSSNNVNNTVKILFGEYKITPSLINLLIDRVGNDIYLLNSEIEKIKIYKDKNLDITEEDILNLTTKNIDTDIFELINSIISDNKYKAICIYNELLKLNEEPIKLIITLANKFRLMYQTKELYKKGYTEGDIAKNLATSPAHINMLLKISRSYDSNILLEYLSKLANLDEQIKKGLINKDLALELFILSK